MSAINRTSELKPFRDYSEHDVINLYKFSGTLPADNGKVVSIQQGWTQSDELDMIDSVGASYDNTVSQRWGVDAAVRAANTGDLNPLGMLLYSVREEDENGEKLKFNPRKAAEMEVVLSGQAVPVVTKGVFLYSGSTLEGQTVTAGQKLYSDANGLLTTGNNGNPAVAQALGSVDSTYKTCLIKLEL
jgi:hypothetical protein